MSKKKRVKTRDYLMKRLIEGATKSGVHKDRKKEQSRLAAREYDDVEMDEDEYEDEICSQCYFPLTHQDVDGFCSERCRDLFNESLNFDD